MFKALLLEKSEAGVQAAVRMVDEAGLPQGDVLLQVEHSTLNYKDALAITHRGPVVRAWPMVAGIDGAGTVLESTHAAWKPGDRVVHNGWGVGETRWGCLAQRARLEGDWLVALPAAFTTRQAMAIGTASSRGTERCWSPGRRGVWAAWRSSCSPSSAIVSSPPPARRARPST